VDPSSTDAPPPEARPVAFVLALLAWPVAHPRLALFLVALLTLGTGALLPRASVDFSLEQLYPRDSPAARFHQAHQQRFGRDDDLLFVARSGDPFAAVVAEVEAGLAEVPGVLEPRSVHSLQVVDTDESGTTAARPLQPGESHPLATHVLLSADGSAGGVAARVADTHNHHTARAEIVDAITALTQETGEPWIVSGIPVIRTAYVRLLLQDMRLLLPIAVLISSAFFIASFRDWRHVLLGSSTVTLGAAAASAAYAATGTPFNVFAPAFIAVIIVVGTSDLIHLVHRFAEQFAALGDRQAAARAAAREVGLACVLTSFTTALGFLALLTTRIPPIRIFGLATGVGVLLTFLITFLAVPPVLAWLGPPSGGALGHASASADRMGRFGAWVLRRRRGVLAIAGLTTVVALALASRVGFEHKVLEDVYSSTETAEALAFMEDHMGAVLPLQIEFSFDEDGEVAGDPRDPKALAAMDALASWLRTQPQVGSMVGLHDLARTAWRSLALPSERATLDLPPTTAASVQSLFALSLAGEDPVPHFLHEGADGDLRARFTGRVRDFGHQATLGLVADFQDQARPLLEPLGGRAEVTGPAYLAQEVNATLTRQFAGSFAVALSLIALVWLGLTRSLRRTGLALVPNVLPLLALLAALGAIDLALKPSTAMVLSIGLGIAVDDTIHFLTVYERRRRRGDNATTAVLHTYRTAGRSILDTSMVLATGFAVFWFSQFVATGNFGVLTAWTVLAALAADLLVLGPLLVTLDRR